MSRQNSGSEAERQPLIAEEEISKPTVESVYYDLLDHTEASEDGAYSKGDRLLLFPLTYTHTPPNGENTVEITEDLTFLSQLHSKNIATSARI